jgi:hypothetical protein
MKRGKNKLYTFSRLERQLNADVSPYLDFQLFHAFEMRVPGYERKVILLSDSGYPKVILGDGTSF